MAEDPDKIAAPARRVKGFSRLQDIGPGAVVTAAFVGPGTVTACSRAGVGFGYSLLWAVAASTGAAIVLQEMSARLGVLSGRDLASVLRDKARAPWLRAAVIVLVGGAVGVGCAAFEGGNLAGGAAGLRLVFPMSDLRSTLVVGAVAVYLLLRGGYRFLERVLIGLVAVMGVTFLLTALLCRPIWGSVLQGILVPSVPEGAPYLLLGLLGTTVVPYNLYLHSRAVREKGVGPERLANARLDLALCIPLGGLVSMAIVVASAVAFRGAEVADVGPRDLATQLVPILGGWAEGFFGLGLLAAGLTSALTAPVAAAYAVCGVLGRAEEARRPLGKGIALGVVAAGLASSVAGWRPLDLIVAAQVANGVLLPVSAGFLLWAMNDAEVLPHHRNRWWQNVLGGIVVVLAIFLGLRSFL
jgi:Mn2+/Fe2+ NRAMP family transporter